MDAPVTSLWPRLKPELSLDLLHAILQDRRQIRVHLFKDYLFHVCGILNPKQELNKLFGCNEEIVDDALKIGLSGIATVGDEQIFYNEDCKRPLPIGAYPTEDVLHTILSVIKHDSKMTTKRLLAICKRHLQIEITLEKLNDLFGGKYKTMEAALEHGLRDYAMFFKSEQFGERITYLGDHRGSGEAKRQFLYTKVRESIIQLIKKRKNIYEDDLVKEIFEEHGVPLTNEIVQELFQGYCNSEDRFSKLRFYKAGLSQHAFVHFIPKQRDFTLLFQCLGTATPHSLIHASKLNPFVVLHDGSANYVAEDPAFHGVASWLSWLYADKARMTMLISHIKQSNTNLDWSDVRVVVMLTGIQALRKKFSPTEIVGDVRDLVAAIKEKASADCEFYVISLPLYPDVTNRNPNTEKVNDALRSLAEETDRLDFHDINESLLRNCKYNWMVVEGHFPFVRSNVFHSELLKFVKQKFLDWK